MKLRTKLGSYEIRSKIGSGGMGEVYLAEDTKLDRQVALKVLLNEVAGDEDRVRRFVREAKAASALNHPNILTVYEIGETEDGTHYIATELIDGKSLNDYLADNDPLPLNRILKIAEQVAEALSAAHLAGIIHRDIKPENIMIRKDGYLKVLDFGLAKLSETRPETSSPEDATRLQVKTTPGMIMGTASYMSPEQMRGKETDARTDLWSLGVVLYEMVTRNSPFEGETKSDTCAAVLTKEPPPLRQFVPNAPGELQRIVRKALAKERDERYQTASDMMTDLKALRRESEMSGGIEHLTVPHTSPASVLPTSESEPTQVFDTRIVIADDHPIFRSGLRQVIETDPTLRIVGETGDGQAALDMIVELAPDIVVLDVNMPGLTGFAVVESMHAKGLVAETVMLTMHNEEAMFAKALSLGVRGYVLKDSAVTDIVNCLHAVRRGQNFTSAEVTKYLFKRASGQTKPVEGLGSLTPAERRVLALIAEYMTSREIADKLSISVRTVENHRNNICAKLGVSGSHALIKFALQHKSSL